jgi:hypothetical protein
VLQILTHRVFMAGDRRASRRQHLKVVSQADPCAVRMAPLPLPPVYTGLLSCATIDERRSVDYAGVHSDRLLHIIEEFVREDVVLVFALGAVRILSS